MRNVLCLIGRHRWERRHNPEVDGRRGDFHVCARCGTDRPTYDPPSQTRYRGVWG